MRPIADVLADARADREAAEKATPGPYYDDAAISGSGSVVMARVRVAHVPAKDGSGNHANDAANMARNADPARVKQRAADVEGLAAALAAAEASDAESAAMYRRARDRADVWQAWAHRLAEAIRDLGYAPSVLAEYDAATGGGKDSDR